jgi:hypothetical protein
MAEIVVELFEIVIDECRLSKVGTVLADADNNYRLSVEWVGGVEVFPCYVCLKRPGWNDVFGFTRILSIDLKSQKMSLKTDSGRFGYSATCGMWGNYLDSGGCTAAGPCVGNPDGEYYTWRK